MMDKFWFLSLFIGYYASINFQNSLLEIYIIKSRLKIMCSCFIFQYETLLKYLEKV